MYSDISVNHDMARLEREERKRLYEKAKKMSREEQGKYQYLVSGPPLSP